LPELPGLVEKEQDRGVSFLDSREHGPGGGEQLKQLGNQAAEQGFGQPAAHADFHLPAHWGHQVAGLRQLLLPGGAWALGGQRRYQAGALFEGGHGRFAHLVHHFLAQVGVGQAYRVLFINKVCINLKCWIEYFTAFDWR
jgi:hypothetical protein